MTQHRRRTGGQVLVDELKRLLEEARRPLTILGGSRWTEAARTELIAWSERWALPVATSFRRASLFPADHPNYAGDVGIGPNPKLAARVKEADLLLLIGGRMSEMPSSSYTLLDIPVPVQRLVHVHPGAEELGRVYAPTLAIQASPGAFCTALRAMDPRLSPPGTTRPPRPTPPFANGRSARPRCPGRFSMARPWSGCVSGCRATQ